MDFAEFWPSDAPSLSEAKNYIEKYQNKKIILKYGGQVMATDRCADSCRLIRTGQAGNPKYSATRHR